MNNYLDEQGDDRDTNGSMTNGTQGRMGVQTSDWLNKMRWK